MRTFSMTAILAGLLGTAAAQDHKDLPKPGPEHSLLKQQFEGSWDAVAKHSRDGKQEESRGTETVKAGYNGFWLTIDYAGDMDGKSFKGHGLLGYDPSKKKYVQTWVDNMAPFAMWAEGEADSQGKKFTFSSEGFCPELGRVAKIRLVMEVQDATHRTLTFFMPGKDGSEEKKGEIFYTRRTS